MKEKIKKTNKRYLPQIDTTMFYDKKCEGNSFNLDKSTSANFII